MVICRAVFRRIRATLGARGVVRESRSVSQEPRRSALWATCHRWSSDVLAGGAMLIGGLACCARVGESQPTRRPAVTLRVGSAIHIAGLTRSLKPQLGLGPGKSWQHHVMPAVALGGTISYPLFRHSVGIRADFDIVPTAELRQDPNGPPLESLPDGRSHWMSASLWSAPSRLCRSRCLAFSAGLGSGVYDYSAIEVRGDIGNYLAPKQRVMTTRVGVEGRLPVWGQRIAVQVADNIGRLTSGYELGERLSPMHTLILSGGIRFGRSP